MLATWNWWTRIKDPFNKQALSEKEDEIERWADAFMELSSEYDELLRDLKEAMKIAHKPLKHPIDEKEYNRLKERYKL